MTGAKHHPWYLRGGMHVNEPMQGLIIAGSHIALVGQLLGPSWGVWHSVHVASVLGCLLLGRLPPSAVDAKRWPAVCLLMPIYFSSLPLALALPTAQVAPTLLLTLVLFMAKIGVCMSVCLHRYAAHGAFKCGPATSLAIQCLGCLANQNGPLWWASNHRCHHKFCDAADVDGSTRDPHSPRLDGAANAFVFYVEHATVKDDFVPRHLDSTAARLLDTFATVPRLVGIGVMYALLGPPGLYAAYVSGWLSQLGSLWFNVINHAPEPPPNAKGVCCASDNVTEIPPPNFFFACLNSLFWLPPLIGEDKHAHHHAFAALAHRPGVDLPYHLFVRPLAALGLLWDLKVAGRDVKLEARAAAE